LRDTAVLRQLLLSCGVISSLLYVAMNVIGAMRWGSYSSFSQTISELSAIGAPTRPLWSALGILYTLLVLAFGCGVAMAARRRTMRIAGALIVVYGALGVLWAFAPMHQREVLAAGGGTFSDTVHIALAYVTVLLMLLAVAFAGVSLGRRFRVYTIATMVMLLAFGVMVGFYVSDIGVNRPTPWVGVWERADVGVFLLWVAVLALALLRRRDLPDDDRESG
jgi:hypothetical protein